MDSPSQGRTTRAGPLPSTTHMRLAEFEGAIGQASKKEGWASVDDATQRRKMQNKLAQRRFREKVKELSKSPKTQQPKANADVESSSSGLPWGGISFRSQLNASSKPDHEFVGIPPNDDSKYACESCIMGHRTSSCNHKGIYNTILEKNFHPA
jgi:hypothetical protein